MRFIAPAVLLRAIIINTTLYGSAITQNRSRSDGALLSGAPCPDLHGTAVPFAHNVLGEAIKAHGSNDLLPRYGLRSTMNYVPMQAIWRCQRAGMRRFAAMIPAAPPKQWRCEEPVCAAHTPGGFAWPK